jgi:hypothetical protein
MRSKAQFCNTSKRHTSCNALSLFTYSTPWRSTQKELGTGSQWYSSGAHQGAHHRLRPGDSSPVMFRTHMRPSVFQKHLGPSRVVVLRHQILTSMHVLLCRVQLPVAAPSRGLLSAGNMATEGVRPLRSLTPLSLAAAGMALCERRWFHVARSAAPGCAPAYPWEPLLNTLDVPVPLLPFLC